MQVLIVSAINSVDGVSDYSKADAIVEAQQELSRLSQVKAKDGGKIGPEDALALVNEAIDMWDTTTSDVPSDELQAGSTSRSFGSGVCGTVGERPSSRSGGAELPAKTS